MNCLRYSPSFSAISFNSILKVTLTLSNTNVMAEVGSCPRNFSKENQVVFIDFF